MVIAFEGSFGGVWEFEERILKEGVLAFRGFEEKVVRGNLRGVLGVNLVESEILDSIVIFRSSESKVPHTVKNSQFPTSRWKALPRFQVVTGTKATLTLNSSEKGGDGGAPSECDNQCHSEKGGDGRNRCLNFIKIHGNGKSVKAMVVDECESTMRCDSDHDYQPPRDSDHDYQPSCANNIVDASKAGSESIGSA
uniref:Uncharacterized protein n=1 Tax=Salix viminalis TaxID=40686 RepID=A0A6N2MDG1_SALVM